MHMWRRPNEQYADCCIHVTQQDGGGSVMVWGAVSLTTKSQLVFIQGNRNSFCYIDQILKPIVVPLAAAAGDDFVFMDDNARPHRAGIVNDYLHAEGITRMDP